MDHIAYCGVAVCILELDFLLLLQTFVCFWIRLEDYVSLVLSSVCRLKHSPWRSWLGWFPASTRSCWAPPYASCSTSPSTRRCAARWSRQDSFPSSPRCSVINQTALCSWLFVIILFVPVDVFILGHLCVYDWGCSVWICLCIRRAIISLKPPILLDGGGASNLLLLRRMCRCSFYTAPRPRAASGDH